MPDNFIEIAFFVIAMIVAFIHWLIKESGIFSGRKKETPEERRALMEQMQRRQEARRNAGETQTEEGDDWAALREAMGLPPAGSQSSPPPPPPPPAYVNRQGPPAPPRHRHYEDSSDAECDDDVVTRAEPESEGVPSFLADFGAAPTADAVEAIRIRNESKAETAARHRADSAYDLPKEGEGGNRRPGRASARPATGSARVARLLRDKEALRQAILAREILGPPKAWQD